MAVYGNPIPLTVIGGYLGAGKTTLINNLLRDANHQKTTVLVNDFGELELDAALLRERAADTISLANGCICCAVGDQLVSALMQIGRRGAPPDDLVIETSGIADPRRVAQIGTAGKRFRLCGIVVVVDPVDVRERAQDSRVGGLVRRQLESADLVVVNKGDLVASATLAEIEHWIEEVAPNAATLCTERGRIASDLLPTKTHVTDERYLSANDSEQRHGVATRTLPLRSGLSVKEIVQIVQGLPRGVLRVKGLVVPAESTSQTWRVDRVGRRVTAQAAGDEGKSVALGELVVIGTPRVIESLPTPLG